MSDLDLAVVSVRPIRPDERARFDAALDEHHWLGHRLVGETMRYVASGPAGEWLAVLGFGAAALACGPRERYIGWSDEQHFARLRYVTNNQRFCPEFESWAGSRGSLRAVLAVSGRLAAM